MLFENPRTKEVIIFIVVIVIFAAISIFSSQYAGQLKNLIQIKGVAGMAIYLLATIASNIIAPISALPLMPLASALWGSFLTALLSILGWSIGASILFYLTRKYGRPLVARFFNVKRVEEIAQAIPEKRFFWGVVFFRIIFPVDLLSIALGLFTKMKWRPYLVATIIGITPFAFILAYGVTLPLSWQITVALIILLATIFLYSRTRQQILNWLKNKK